MALELKLKYEITSDRSKLIVTDETGAYSASNLTGWGSPNSSRSSLGLYAYVTYQPYEGARITLTPITPVFDINNSYPNSYKSEFQFNYYRDGWYRILLVALTQEQYNEVDDPEELINSDTYPNIFVEDIVLVNLIVQRNCLLEKYFECMQCTSCKCDIHKEELVKLDALIQATDYRFHSLKPYEAQKMTEQLTKQFKCCK